MADFILIGKMKHAFSEAPHVVYCGQHKGAALAAAAAANGKFPYLYFVDPQPFQRIAVPALVATQPAPPLTTPIVTPPPSGGDALSHKGHSKSKKS